MWASDPWENSSYCWVVVCKNAKAHNSENMMFGHKIPLAETDSFEFLACERTLRGSVRRTRPRTLIRADRRRKARIRASQRLHNSPAIPVITLKTFLCGVTYIK